MYCRLKFAGGTTYWLEKSSDGVNYAMDGTVTSLPKGVGYSYLYGSVTFNKQGISPTWAYLQLNNGHQQYKYIYASVFGKVWVW